MKLPKLQPGTDITLKPGEHISRVTNKITGEEFYASNLYTRSIQNEEFQGVFKRPSDHLQNKINWMRRDHLVFEK